MRILVVNGPNLNMLGLRDAGKYGKVTMKEINSRLKTISGKNGIDLEFFQSNHEGEIIDFLQKESSRRCNGLLINPGALTHYGYGLRDAVVDLGLPVVEVHLSDISRYEEFRKTDVLEGIIKKRFMGLKDKSYYAALDYLTGLLLKK